MKRKLVIDTDGVVDDVRAVSLALQSSEAELLALTAVNGCVTVGQAVANLARTLRANGKRVPIYRGAEFPLVGNGHTHLDEVHFFGSDGLGNAPNAFPKVLPEDFEAHEKDKHAALALIALFQQHPDVTLVCIGPLTNVALALKLMPGFAKLPARLVMLGGNVHGMGNVRSYSTAEWNFSNDPQAAHIVLKEMQCPITLVPWETFVRESYQSAIDFHAHLDMDFPLANYFNTCTSIGRSILAKVDRQYAYCDEIAVGVAINPEGLIKSSKMLRASVELHGQLTRGQVAIDWYNYNPKVCTQRTPIQFVLDYDVHLLDQMIVHAIRSSLFAVAVEANGDSGSVEEKRVLKEGSQS